MMKLILLVFFSVPLFANTFRLPETSGRFDLLITKNEFAYKSEVLTKTLKLKPCSLALAKKLNSNILSRLPASVSDKGLPFIVDEKSYFLKSDSELSRELVMMDGKILQFLAEEKASCK